MDSEITSMVLSKVTPPRMSGVFPRERLFSLMDALEDHPVLWIQAPGGSGKSTLVASHLCSLGRPHLWYQVDSGDADIATFFHYLRSAAARKDKAAQMHCPSWTPDQILSIPLFARRFFTSLFTLLPSIAIVFDNYQDLPAGAPLHEAIREAFGIIPPGARIIVISREAPSAAFSRLLANGIIGTIGWGELRLDSDEARKLVNTKGGVELSDEKLKYLYDKTEGWAAGIVLMVEHLRRMGPDLSMLERINTEGVFDYFASEIFDLADLELQDFLLKTAHLNRIPVSIAEKLTNNHRAHQILSSLAKSNYFTTRHQGLETTFQYHQLFQEFLRVRATERIAPEELRALKVKTATLLEEADFTEDAGNIYMKLEEWDALSAMALKKAQVLVTQGRTGLLGEWLSEIPSGTADKNPWLLFWLGICKFGVSPQESSALLERAFSIFRDKGDRTGLFLSWCAVVDTAIHVSQYLPMRQWLIELDDILREDPSFPSREIEVRVSLSRFNAAAFVLPDHKDIASMRQQAYDLICTEKIADANLFLSTGLHLVIHFIYQGDFTRGSLILDLLRGSASPSEATELVRIMVKTMESHYAFATCSLEACIDKAFEALSLAADSGIHIWDTHLYGHAIAAALAMGNENLFAELAPKMAAGLDGARSVDRAYYQWLLAWNFARNGEFQQAGQHLELALKLATEIGFLAPGTAMSINMAEICLERGNVEEAAAWLEKTRATVLGMNSAYLSFCHLATEATLKFNCGDAAKGNELLRAAFALGRENRIENFYSWRPAFMTRLCMKALEAGIEIDYVQNLIVRRKLIPQEPPIHIENWPWPIRIYTMGKFVLIKDGGEVAFSGKVQKKPLEMLKALVALGGEEPREGQLADLLWPESDGDVARNSFKVTLHRLRELLGNDKALQLKEGRLAMNPQLAWTDVQAFEHLLGMAQRAGEEGDEAGAVRIMAQALHLYRGHFLAGDDKPWLVPMRERLRRLFSLNISVLAGVAGERGDYQRSMEWYERGLAVDHTNEELYQQIMRTCLSADRPGDALATYQRCQRTLATGLGLTPSLTTTALYRQALAQEKR